MAQTLATNGYLQLAPGYNDLTGQAPNQVLVQVISAALAVALQNLIAGERNASNANTSYLDVRTVSNARILSTTNSTNFQAGVCTGVGGAAGAANDTILMGLIFLPNAAAVTATCVGFQDDTGAAANYVFSGTTAALNAGAYDLVPLGLINDKGALSITASVASKVIVMTRPA